jgi:predicted membrane-bound spermidine synthase
MAAVYVLFFLSGIPALIYQIVWQRTLFAIYGVNIESVTVVVSAFMLGLGLGSLAGGRVSKRARAPLLLFGAMELGIAAYGVASLPLFRWVAGFSAGAPPAESGVLSFAMVLLPTVMMGATLPLLTAHLVRLSGNVGRSVGVLYFVNTLGSAAACFLAALVTMPDLGMSGSVGVATAINAVVGTAVLGLHFAGRGAATDQPPEPKSPPGMLPFGLAVVLAGAAGFLSLCYEIVWYRIYSFATAGPAQCFSFVLGAFLTGIALGALLSRRMCRLADPARLTRSIASLILMASVLGIAIAPQVADIVRHASYLWTLPLIAAAAGLLGATFPLLCHVSIRADGGAGAGLSYLYLANIIGSAGGCWIVGFVLMDWLTLHGISVLLALIGIVVALTLWCSARVGGRGLAVGFVLAALISSFVLRSSRPYETVYGKMQYKQDWGAKGTRLTDTVETRSGVVTVDEDGAIFGGGAFDGWVTADIHETDLLRRPLALSFFHPDPKDVLEIGLSGGGWSEIIGNHSQLDHQVVVEINPGYLEVIRRYPSVAPILRNPKVEIVIDDGRRWMLRNRDRKFDVIVMDTIYHWRAQATSLLSVEFLDLARQMLKPGGILYYNTTFSWEAQRTGAVHFPYAVRFGPFMVVSDSPIAMGLDRWKNVLVNYRLEGKPIFDLRDAEDREILQGLLDRAKTLPGNSYVSEGMETRENILRRTAGRRIITDDNMATEWR